MEGIVNERMFLRMARITLFFFFYRKKDGESNVYILRE